MNTAQALKQYFSKDNLQIQDDLESKKDLKGFFKKKFKKDLDNGMSPILGFQVLYHRINEIASVAKDVFYEPAIAEIKKQLDEDSKSLTLFGSEVQLRTVEQYDFIKSPRILKLEKEIAAIEKKNSKVIKSYEKFQSDVKSINKQIKAEQERLIETGMATKKGSNESISLSY